MSVEDLQSIDREIEDCETQLRKLRAKKRQIKNPDSLTMTVDEAGELLGVGRNTIYKAARNGQIPTIRIGKRDLVPVAAIKKLLNGETP